MSSRQKWHSSFVPGSLKSRLGVGVEEMDVAEAQNINPQNLKGIQKAAVVLVSLGTETSARIMKHLSDEEVERLAFSIAEFPRVPVEVREEILEEFARMCAARGYIAEGGIAYAKEILEKAFGPQKAAETMEKLTAYYRMQPFSFARNTDPGQLLNFIQGEHPQTIALIMAHLDAEQAAAILSSLPPEDQTEVAMRIAQMETTSPEVLEEVERLLETRISSLMTRTYTSPGGIKSAVDILNHVDRTTEKTILDTLSIDDPELAEEIRKRMFVFDDIVTLDDRAIQLVLREVEFSDLAMAMRVASDEVKARIMKNVSSRVKEMLDEEMAYMGPVRLREVEEAQQRIVAIVRRLDDTGQIIIARGGEGDIVV